MMVVVVGVVESWREADGAFEGAAGGDDDDDDDDDDERARIKPAAWRWY
jgi:hypothetical protein